MKREFVVQKNGLTGHIDKIWDDLGKSWWTANRGVRQVVVNGKAGFLPTHLIFVAAAVATLFAVLPVLNMIRGAKKPPELNQSQAQ